MHNLQMLRLRGHDESTVMSWEEHYVSYVRTTNLLVVGNIVYCGMPPFNVVAVTAMVDRWRPETYSFHLPCGEMTVTLEDAAVILGLPIRGQPVTGNCDPAGWQDRVTEFLGVVPLA